MMANDDVIALLTQAVNRLATAIEELKREVDRLLGKEQEDGAFD